MHGPGSTSAHGVPEKFADWPAEPRRDVLPHPCPRGKLYSTGTAFFRSMDSSGTAGAEELVHRGQKAWRG